MRKPGEIIINGKTLEEILDNHMHWIKRDIVGWEYMRANLCTANLKNVDLNGAYLRDADLRNANLSGVDLRNADLRSAYLYSADMSGADLRNANLRNANLQCAYLRDADLRNADLRDADLRNAYLYCVNLHNANLSGADRLRGGIKLSEPIIGWKKCKDNVLVKLEIPRGAIVFAINNNKCRTDKAKVLEIIGGDRAYSNHKFFSYYVGDIIEVFNFNCKYNVECAEGIHFFRTLEEAENYQE